MFDFVTVFIACYLALVLHDWTQKTVNWALKMVMWSLIGMSALALAVSFGVQWMQTQPGIVTQGSVGVAKNIACQNFPALCNLPDMFTPTATTAAKVPTADENDFCAKNPNLAWCADKASS